MMILDTTSKVIQAVLGGAVTANQLRITSHYEDITTTTYAPSSNRVVTNNTTAVTVVGSPAASTQRKVLSISIYNKDTVDAVVTVQAYDGTNTDELVKVTLDPGDTLYYVKDVGWRVTDSAGRVKTVTGTGSTEPSDGDKGDITVSASGLTWTIDVPQLPLSYLDTDGALAANSDAKVASQKATKTYVDTIVTGLLDFKGSTDCSTNPNYPAASKGDAYVVSVAGKIGGASGKSVDVGDVYVASADNAGGTEASVGTSWFVLEHNLAGALLSANNLSDLASAATARTNLGAVGLSDTQTLTNKRVTPRVGTVASSATPSINTDNYDVYTITALAVDITSFSMSGTPTDGQELQIAITGTASRSIAWGASFESGNASLPSGVFGTTRMDVFFVWNAATSKWRCVGQSGGGNPAGVVYVFDTTTTDSDPGAGKIRLNNANPALATYLYIDDLNKDGAYCEGWIETFDDGAGSIKGNILLSVLGDTDANPMQVLAVTGSVIDGTGYWKIPVSSVMNVNSLSNGDPVVIHFTPGGNITVSDLLSSPLPENVAIQLDAALSADGKYSGIVLPSQTAGAALAFGDLCYLAAVDDRWELTDSDTEATAGPVMLGMCVLAAAGDGSATSMLLIGLIRADAKFPTLTKSAPAYVGTTAGEIQVAAPSGTGDIIRSVGRAQTADVLFFNPSNDYYEHA